MILEDLESKMVFLEGPRHVGKTWLVHDIAKEFRTSVYLNYEDIFDRNIIETQAWNCSADLLILDELYKMEGWKNFLKGVYDTKPESMRLLVTGSVRLEVYDRTGDSLVGRYFRHRLLPLSLAELEQVGEFVGIDQLLEQGGFLVKSAVEVDRLREQVDVFEKVRDMKAMWLVLNVLRARVGSPISYQSLAEDIGVLPTTVKKYIEILEALYVVFRVTPVGDFLYSKNIACSLLKEPKFYFFDTGLVQGDGRAKLENLVAVSLLKHVYALTWIIKLSHMPYIMCALKKVWKLILQ
jgi:Predicted ATPase (AAA+ superfamily)